MLAIYYYNYNLIYTKYRFRINYRKITKWIEVLVTVLSTVRTKKIKNASRGLNPTSTFRLFSKPGIPILCSKLWTISWTKKYSSAKTFLNPTKSAGLRVSRYSKNRKETYKNSRLVKICRKRSANSQLDLKDRKVYVKIYNLSNIILSPN
jgi:hypothetical protein